MKAPRLGCERPAGEHDKLELGGLLHSFSTATISSSSISPFSMNPKEA